MVKAILFVGLGAAGLALLAGTSHAASPVNAVPAGWEPPPEAVTVNVPAQGALKFPVRGATWKANGQDVVLWWDPTTAGGPLALPAILAIGDTSNSQVLLSILKPF